MVDWSGGGDTGPRPRKDAIWAAVRCPDADLPALYLRNRDLALDWLSALVGREVAAGRRLLIGFDFPFGYPAGFAAQVTGRADPLALWDWLQAAFDALPAGAGRFDVAAQLNRRFPGVGPFWFNGLRRSIADLPRKGTWVGGHGMAARRLAEQRAPGAFTCWQMGGAGAVGSQAMTGMATLARLRGRHPDAISVWPFQPLDRPVALVEIWPSLLRAAVAKAMDASGETIRDRAQVEVMARTVAAAQDRGELAAMLAAVPTGPPRDEEGWILGVGSEAALKDAAEATVLPTPGAGGSLHRPGGAPGTAAT